MTPLCAWLLWMWLHGAVVPSPNYIFRGAFDSKQKCEARALDEEWNDALRGEHIFSYRCLPAEVGHPSRLERR
jgi:hypothetical protein